MLTVKQLADKCGVTVRTLHHYDAIGLLKPALVTEAGYRLYDDTALERLCLILLFRELGFQLKDIRGILDAPDFDCNRVLEQQIVLLKQKQRHLESMTTMAQGVRMMGVTFLELEGFNMKKFDDYSQQAKALYGKTEAYREYAQKEKHRTREQSDAINGQVMEFFVRLGKLKNLPADSEAVQDWVQSLQAFFTEHYYNCTPELLMGLGQLYAEGGSMTENIDAAGGAGTGAFARDAIACYCKK